MARFGSRRGAHALAALLVAVATITAATVAAGPSASAASSSYDPDGVLHYAYDLASIAPVFDPAQATIGDRTEMIRRNGLGSARPLSNPQRTPPRNASTHPDQLRITVRAGRATSGGPQP